MTRLLITDSVPLNTGDAAILHGILALLTRALPEVEIRIHAHQRDLAAKRYRDLPLYRSLADSSREFPHRSIWRLPGAWRFPVALRYEAAAGCPFRATRTLAPLVASAAERRSITDYIWADVIISCGGSFLTDTYYLDFILAGYNLGLALGKRMILLGQTLGPFRQASKAALVAGFLRRFDLVVVRDERSVDVARKLQLSDARLVLGADMAFNLATETTREHADSGPVRVGVSVRKWIYPNSAEPGRMHASYVSRMARALDLIVAQSGVTITFISTCQGEAEYAFHDDEVAEEVRGLMEFGDRTEVDHNFNTPMEFTQKVSRMHAFIGTRMHSCILALMAGVPAINLEYEFKSRELYRRLGCEEFVLDVTNFRPEEVAELLQAVLGSRHIGERFAAGVKYLQGFNREVTDRVRRVFSA
jgi:colanic acid/amylovoran biosynthesis protein